MIRKPLIYVAAAVILIVVILAFAGLGNHKIDASAGPDTTVYVTNTGECYHRSSCRSLQYSKHEITLNDAKSDGFRACRVCKPPKSSAE